ncbi:MAG: carboxymuconolactone decarboxylase family protein [Actinomycetota bacterium]|nr:carboxymuconolactone decarboxylase family protein [Actinomycetota bacterium]
MTTSERWRSEAHEAFSAFDHVEAIAAAAVDEALMFPVRRAVSRLLRNDDEFVRTSDGAQGGRSDPRALICVRFAEQFVVDVAGITDADRAMLSGALGSETFTFVQALFVVDVFQRARIALQRLYAVPYDGPPAAEPGDLWAAIEEFMRVVARASVLDPLTTELIRLRGATVHHCRLCRSRLSVRALDAAGDDSPFSAIEDFEHSVLGSRHKVALRLTDAVVTQPAQIDDQLVAQVHAAFSVGESTEIVLDVVRNAANKIAVALGADAPQVADGIEFFDVDANGDVVASVDAEVVRRAAGA